MYRGSGVPQLVKATSGDIPAKIITFPKPLKGKRKEEYEIVNKVYTNIRGMKIPMQTKYRFTAEYEFGDVGNTLIDDLVELHDTQNTIKLIPHSDMVYINYMVYITKIDPRPLKGHIAFNSLRISFESINYVHKIPTIDNMMGGMLLTHVGVLDGSSLGVGDPS